MKNIVKSLGVVFLIGSIATAAPAIKDNMDAINTLVNSITASVTVTSKNSANSASAKQIADQFKIVLTLVPTSISSMPDGASKDAALADFKNLIQTEIDNATALETAFDKNDNTTASGILQQMASIKSVGHSKYKK